MFGFGAFAELPFCDFGIAATPTPIVIIDTHDGDKILRKKHEKEKFRKNRQTAELKAIYEELVEGKPRNTEEIAAPYMVVTDDQEAVTVSPSVDFDKLFNSLSTIEKIHKEYLKLHREDHIRDDEEVLLLL